MLFYPNFSSIYDFLLLLSGLHLLLLRLYSPLVFTPRTIRISHLLIATAPTTLMRRVVFLSDI